MHYRDISCHGILEGLNGKLHLVSFLLGLKPMDTKDSLTVGSWMRTLLEEYGITPEKRGVITADGAEKVAAREAGLEYWWCIGHWINLAIHDAITASNPICESSPQRRGSWCKMLRLAGAPDYLMIENVQRNLPGLRRHGYRRWQTVQECPFEVLEMARA